MSKVDIFQSCVGSLIKILAELETALEPAIAKKITMALRFANELKSMGAIAPESPAALIKLAPDSDTTNYETYKLLRNFGLTSSQLITIAMNEGLHELRILRMIRTVFDIGLEEARSVLEQAVLSSEQKN